MIPFALEHTIEQHMTITVVDHAMERTVGDHDHIAGTYCKRLISFVAYNHVSTTLYKKVNFFLTLVPMTTSLLSPIQPSRTQHKIIEIVVVSEHIDFIVLDYFTADVMYVIFLHPNIS